MRFHRPGTKAARLLLLAAALVTLFFGWRLFLFMTDDAFIAFRYASNRALGFGYVWNAPPFRPVEGYTSFLWLFLLDLVWRLLGIEPPGSANVLSLVFSALTLALSFEMARRVTRSSRLEGHADLMAGLVLLGILTNRTFLAWTSSGLETALFNFLLAAWVFASLFVKEEEASGALAMGLTAGLLYLTRPDGLLYVGATILLLCRLAYRESNLQAAIRRVRFGYAALFLVPLHLAWRHATYGAWLPNTYYAKVVSGRLAVGSGLRYLLSFALEYGLVLWLGLLLATSLVALRRSQVTPKEPATGISRRLLVLAPIFFHLAYYTFVVGGDHFEFRVYSHVVPFLWISFVWMAGQTGWNTRRSTAVLGAFLALSWIIPWTHWAITKDIASHREARQLRAPVAYVLQEAVPGAPRTLLAYFRLFDDLQSWLIVRGICMRHQEHKLFTELMLRSVPPREIGKTFEAGEYPVLMFTAVGVVSWSLPRVNILDTFGLNDYVVARNPDLRPGNTIAHERQPPPGYVECFLPNIQLQRGVLTRIPRPEELTAERIRDCEARYASVVERKASKRR